MKYLSQLFVLLLLLACTVAPAWSQGTDESQTDTWRNFSNLITTIESTQEELADARKGLSEAQLESERKRAGEEVERLNNELSSLQTAWEMWATGGVDMQLFATTKQQEEKKFDWREELQTIFEPIIVEMRRLTDRPRKIERLRSDQAYYEQRLVAADAALKSVGNYHVKAPTADLVTAFSDLEDRWKKRREDLKTRLDLVNFELQELTAPKADQEQRAINALKELFTGRLLNLILAVAVGAVVYGLFWKLNQLHARYMLRRGRNPHFISRVVHLVLVMVASLLALLAGMSVLYVRGDWILLGLVLIVLFGLVLALQRTLPGYLGEAKLMLNIGAVREGERVIYRGLPWRVQTLRLQATLLNPLLSGGVLRLPLKELIPLISRVANEHEPWFPTRENDYVLLKDDTYGQVVLQTPESVQVRIFNTIKTFSTPDFMAQSPKNLSLEGFMASLRFGVDYKHQSEVTGSIRDALEKALVDGLQREPQGKYLQGVTVEFAEADASSLNFVAFASFSAEAAGSYLYLQNLMQRIAVDACNTHGWLIPFNQMTVHLSRED